MTHDDTSRARVVIDSGACQGHGMCVLYAPAVFQLDDVSDQGAPVTEYVSGADVELARQGVEVCPERAISLTFS